MINSKYTKIYLFLVFVIFTTTAVSITFEPSLINDSNEPSYLKFEGKDFDLSNSFEKIAADFNGDGHEDILSLGGDIFLITDTVSPIPPPILPFAPIELMLYSEGRYVPHDLGLDNFSYKANIIDIDFDGDLDIVMMNGEIAINDGQANFTTIKFTESRYLSTDFFTTDIDADGDLDIISKSFIFANNGDFTFTEMPNTINATSDIFHAVDVNNDNVVDLINIENNELQTWINEGSGNFNLFSGIEIPDNALFIHALSKSKNNLQNFILVYQEDSQDKMLVMENNKSGSFSISELNLSVGNIEYDTVRIGKLYNKDANNNGVEDLWVAGVFVNSDSCQNSQNLLLVYTQRENKSWIKQLTLHSEGILKENLFSTRATVDNLPTIVDLNNDNLPDVVLAGDTPNTWISQEAIFNEIGVQYRLSNASKNQYIKTIDAVDYDNDGDVDIFSAAQNLGSCELINYSEGLSSAVYQINSILWINNGDGLFESFSSPFGGGNDFLRPYEYMIFADLENNGEQNIIATIPEEGNRPKVSYYVYPRLADPGLAFLLPLPTTNAKVANLDNTGETKEIVMIADTDEAPIVIYSLSNGQFIEIARFEFGAPMNLFGTDNQELQLADMDNDGNIDIVASQNIGGDNVTNIWFNNGKREFTKSQDYADNAFGIAVLDINNDGLLDLFSSSLDIRLNRGNQVFEKISYDSSFWSTAIGLPFYGFLVPKNIKVTDFNNDGKDDVIFINSRELYVYINNSKDDQISFYSVYLTQFRYSIDFNYDDYRSVIVDINNDNKMDFVVNTGNNIQLNTQVDESPVTGLYFDPIFNGHGFSTHDLGRKNLYYSIFYSYDEEGKPEWFTTINRYMGVENAYSPASSYNFTGEDFESTIRYVYDYTTQTSQADLSSDNLGNYYFSSSNLNRTLDTAKYNIGDENASWNIHPIISETQKPVNDFSGLWWAGEDDDGWGVSLSFIQREKSQEVVALLYFYDDAGQPRWLIGQQSDFQANQEITINMNQINGYGREQNFVELNQIPAGTMTINLKQASNTLNEAGILSMNVFYPDDQTNKDNWLRTQTPIALFSKPMD